MGEVRPSWGVMEERWGCSACGPGGSVFVFEIVKLPVSRCSALPVFTGSADFPGWGTESLNHRIIKS